MLDIRPPPPRGWTPLHSVAYMLLGVAVADDELDAAEAERLVQVMARYQGVRPEEARGVLALAHAYLVAVLRAFGRQGYLESIVKHAALLANRYGREMLAPLVSDMVAIALADGTVTDEELAFIRAASDAWGVSAEA